MFRHQGKYRTYSHNLKVATLLSWVAGIVNVAGFLAVQKLTTNVTGHFAFFVDEVFKLKIAESLVYFLYILFFLLGSFASSFMLEAIYRKNERYIFLIPVLFEALALSAIAASGSSLISANQADVIAYGLLFAMGLQNSLVTRISGAQVRTTHLTGLFTDLGIELSQLFFYKIPEQKKKLLSNIRLRLRIINFFFLGGITGGILYSRYQIHALFLPAAALITGLFYDTIKFRILSWTRTHK